VLAPGAGRLPVTRKSRVAGTPEGVAARQQLGRLGGYSAMGWNAQRAARPPTRVFQSPGPIYEPEGPARRLLAHRARHASPPASWPATWCTTASATTSRPAPGSWKAAPIALGCTVFPGGVGNTELQLQAMTDLRPDAYAGTPSFLRILLEKAAETGVALPSLKKALVSGEAFPPSLRDWLAERGVQAYQAYATAEAGVIAYETAAREGLVLDEGVILEIVRPGTGDPVPDGEVGEVVVTVLNPDYPLLRFGTGDLSAMLPGPCPTGRSNTRIKGWMGRADQTAKVRGMFVHPSQVAEVLKRHPKLLKARLVVQARWPTTT
jgi:phenylacetate-CoA ligase